jgi:hypothetical protein
MAIFMTSSRVGVDGIRADWDRYIPKNIPRRGLRPAGRRGLDLMAMSRKFGDLAVNLRAVGSTGVDQGLVRLVDAQLAQKSRTLAAPGRRIADGAFIKPPRSFGSFIKGMQNEQDIAGGCGCCGGGVGAGHGQRRD